MLVHVDGVDFTILDPFWLALALFMAIPGLYAGSLTLLVERWLRPGSWLNRAPAPLAIAPILLAAPIAPFAGIFAVGWLLLRAAERSGIVRHVVRHPASAWVARSVLAALFAFGLFDLVRDVVSLA